MGLGDTLAGSSLRFSVGRFTTEDEAAAYASWLLHNKWVDRAHAFPSTSR